MKRLNMGCGSDIKDGFINIDMFPATGVDMIIDLNNDITEFFEEGSVDFIYLSHVLEHLDQPSVFLTQVHKILKIGGKIEIRVPHRNHSDAYSIFHKQYFDENSFDDMIRKGGGLQNLKLFTIESLKVYRQHIWSDWHVNHYFGIDTGSWPTGVKKEINIILRR
jgi:SAM-dependent methyltransferase